MAEEKRKESYCSLYAYYIPKHFTYVLSFPSCTVLQGMLSWFYRWPTWGVRRYWHNLMQVTKLAHSRARIQSSVLQNACLMQEEHFLPLLPLNYPNFLPVAPSSDCAFSLTLPRALEATPCLLLLLIYLTHSHFFIIAFMGTESSNTLFQMSYYYECISFHCSSADHNEYICIRADVTGICDTPF